MGPVLNICFQLHGQCLLIQKILHVPALQIPLYSCQAHLCQRGCGFVGSFDMVMHVYFSGVILSVHMLTDCHLLYEPLGKSTPLSSLNPPSFILLKAVPSRHVLLLTPLPSSVLRMLQY